MLLEELIYSPFISRCMYPRFAQLILLAIGGSLLLGLIACSKRLHPAHSEQTHHEVTQRRQQWTTQLHRLDERDSLTLDLTEELLPPPLPRDSGQTRSTPALRHWHGTLSRHHTQIGSLIQQTKEQDSLHGRSQQAGSEDPTRRLRALSHLPVPDRGDNACRENTADRLGRTFPATLP